MTCILCADPLDSRARLDDESHCHGGFSAPFSSNVAPTRRILFELTTNPISYSHFSSTNIEALFTSFTKIFSNTTSGSTTFTTIKNKPNSTVMITAIDVGPSDPASIVLAMGRALSSPTRLQLHTLLSNLSVVTSCGKVLKIWTQFHPGLGLHLAANINSTKPRVNLGQRWLSYAVKQIDAVGCSKAASMNKGRALSASFSISACPFSFTSSHCPYASGSLVYSPTTYQFYRVQNSIAYHISPLLYVSLGSPAPQYLTQGSDQSCMSQSGQLMIGGCPVVANVSISSTPAAVVSMNQTFLANGCNDWCTSTPFSCPNGYVVSSVSSASFWANASSCNSAYMVDVTAQVLQQCEGLNACNPNVSGSTDPCPSNTKWMSASFTCLSVASSPMLGLPTTSITGGAMTSPMTISASVAAGPAFIWSSNGLYFMSLDKGGLTLNVASTPFEPVGSVTYWTYLNTVQMSRYDGNDLNCANSFFKASALYDPVPINVQQQLAQSQGWDGGYDLAIQSDGNLVVYYSQTRVVYWAAWGGSNGGFWSCIQSERGSKSQGECTWANYPTCSQGVNQGNQGNCKTPADQGRSGPFQLQVTNDGFLQVVDAFGEILWSSSGFPVTPTSSSGEMYCNEPCSINYDDLYSYKNPCFNSDFVNTPPGGWNNSDSPNWLQVASTPPGPSSCTLPAGIILYCNSSNTSDSSSYLSVLNAQGSVSLRPFSTNGYLLAGTPTPNLIVPYSWCSGPTVLHCPVLTSQIIPGIPVTNNETSQTQQTQVLQQYQIQSANYGNCLQYQLNNNTNFMDYSWNPNKPFVPCSSSNTVFNSLLAGDTQNIQRISIQPHNQNSFANNGCSAMVSSASQGFQLVSPASTTSCSYSSLSQQFSVRTVGASASMFMISSTAYPNLCLSSIGATYSSSAPASFATCNSSDSYQWFNLVATLGSTQQIVGASSSNPYLATYPEFTFNDQSLVNKIMAAYSLAAGPIGVFATNTTGKSFTSYLVNGDQATVTPTFFTTTGLGGMTGVPPELFKRLMTASLQAQYGSGPVGVMPINFIFMVSNKVQGLETTVSMGLKVITSNLDTQSGCSAGAKTSLTICKWALRTTDVVMGVATDGLSAAAWGVGSAVLGAALNVGENNCS